MKFNFEFYLKENINYRNHLMIELMSKLQLDHHKKTGSTGLPFGPTMRILNSGLEIKRS